MHIAPSTPEDLARIRELFGEAMAYQKKKFGKHWQGLNEEALRVEIGEKLHWKILERDEIDEADGFAKEDEIAAFFSIAFSDALVWDERDSDPAIYLHRIVTNPAFRGRGYVPRITDWAKAHGAARGKKFVRLDTDKDNAKLNAYYQECGYRYRAVKVFRDKNDSRVPLHYFGAGLSLFEIEIPEIG
jgi:ribosomal protein S18 acetylase RimI-like enzyme